MPEIIDHTHPESVRLQNSIGKHKWNGAYYYSVEVVQHFIPNIVTDRNWITIRAGEVCLDHSIVFVHDIWRFEEKYGYTFPYEDIVYVVSMPDMLERVGRHGKVVYLPLSVDVQYVERFKREKDRKLGFFGRTEWRENWLQGAFEFPKGTDFVGMVPREELLWTMARYEQAYAVCRTAIEAKILGCEVLPFHQRFPDVSQWEVIDSRDAARMLQSKLDEIDGR